MPPRAVPKKRVALMRRRFRDLIDWAFDGNLSLAARALRMPVSTVQKYYQEGPRRISSEALERIDELTELGSWVAGEGEGTIWESFRTISRGDQPDGAEYVIPQVVMWRVNSVMDAMSKRVNADRDAVRDAFFAPILEGLNIGLFRGAFSGTKSFFNPAVVGIKAKRGRSGAALLGWNLARAKQIHRLCEFWEGELS